MVMTLGGSKVLARHLISQWTRCPGWRGQERAGTAGEGVAGAPLTWTQDLQPHPGLFWFLVPSVTVVPSTWPTLPWPVPADPSLLQWAPALPGEAGSVTTQRGVPGCQAPSVEAGPRALWQSWDELKEDLEPR